jgi:hypothetical protein
LDDPSKEFAATGPIEKLYGAAIRLLPRRCRCIPLEKMLDNEEKAEQRKAKQPGGIEDLVEKRGHGCDWQF